MKRDDSSLMSPPLEDLLSKIPQKYELVLTATKRAKQIIREQRLNPAAHPFGTAEVKPLTQALHEIAVGKVDKELLAQVPDVMPDDFFEEEPDIMSDIERGRQAFTTSSGEGFPEFEDDDDVFEDDDDTDIEDDLEDDVLPDD